ncbi:MAG: DUF3147 family protein [Bacteroidota bacterium]
MQYLIKILLSAILVTAISEVAKRSSFWGAVLASLPFLSILAFIFLYTETKDVQKISALSTDIFWLVIPSLALFLTLPFLLKKGIGFYPALGISCLLTVGAYFLMNMALQKLG